MYELWLLSVWCLTATPTQVDGPGWGRGGGTAVVGATVVGAVVVGAAVVGASVSAPLSSPGIVISAISAPALKCSCSPQTYPPFLSLE